MRALLFLCWLGRPAAVVLFAAPRTPSQLLRVRTVRAELPSEIELPLYDVCIDDAPVPFPLPEPSVSDSDEAPDRPPPIFRYTFDRAAYLRMLDDVESRSEHCFGHCLQAGEEAASSDSLASLLLSPDSLARVGTVGCAIRVVDVERGEGSGTAIALVRGTPTFRFVVTDVIRSIPFPVARVRPLHDEPLEAESEDAVRCAELERTVSQSLRMLVQISAKLEAAGPLAEEATEVLASPEALLSQHEAQVLSASYKDTRERWECFSLALCSLIELPHEAAVEAVATTSPLTRFAIVLSVLRAAVQELVTLSSLEGLGGEIGAAASLSEPELQGFGPSNFVPIDIPVGGRPPANKLEEEALNAGTRLEFWWNEEWGWCAATVVRPVRDVRQVHVRPRAPASHALEGYLEGAICSPVGALA